MKRACFSLCSLIEIAGAQAGSGSSYVINSIKVKDLGTLGGEESVAHDINDYGQVVGWAHNRSGISRAFLYRSGAMEEIQIPYYSPNEVIARGINNLTQIVGHFRYPGNEADHTFFWDESFSSAVFLHESFTTESGHSCATGGRAKAINDSGQIVGELIVSCYPPPVPHLERGVLWLSYSTPWYQLTNISVPADDYANDINNLMLITGEETNAVTANGGYLWNQGYLTDVPYPAWSPYQPSIIASMKAFGINDASSVVGQVHVPSDSQGTYNDSIVRAFYWSGTSSQSTMLPIFTNGRNSAAYEVNNQGFSVGYADRKSIMASTYHKKAVIWHKDIGIVELPPPADAAGGTALSPNYCEALSVNGRKDSGLIQAVGYCRLGGKRKAIRWDISTGIKS